MSNKIRISHVSTIGQIIHFLRDYCLIIYLLLSLLLLIIAKANDNLNYHVKNFLLDHTAPVFMVLAIPFDLSYIIKQKYSQLVNLQSQNQTLKEDNQILKDQLFSMLYLKEENLQLKELLKFQDNLTLDYQIAKLYLNIDKAYDRVAAINKGENHGIAKGQAVITGAGLVGRVMKTFSNYSHILLINDYQSNIPVYTAKSGEKAILSGQQNKFPILKYLRKNHNIINNEVVFTSGDAQIYPANIPVGTIMINEKNELELFPFVDFYKLNYVKILLYKN